MIVKKVDTSDGWKVRDTLQGSFFDGTLTVPAEFRLGTDAYNAYRAWGARYPQYRADEFSCFSDGHEVRTTAPLRLDHTLAPDEISYH